MRNLLAFAGRNGPVMLFGGVFVGLLIPTLAESARPLMGAAVFAVLGRIDALTVGLLSGGDASGSRAGLIDRDTEWL